MSRYSLILFDIDGTLVWTKGAGRASTRLAMLEIFGTADGVDTHEFGGKTDWRTLLDLLGDHAHDDIRTAMTRYEESISRHLTSVTPDFPIQPVTAALETVAELRRRDALMGIVTGNVSTTAPIKLQAAGFDPAWFAVGAYGSEALERDDLPALAIERASRLSGRKIAPETVLVVGDTPADIACARACGAVAVAVLTGYSPREALEAAQPDFLLEDLTTFFTTVMDA